MAEPHFRYKDLRELLSSVKNLKTDFNVVTLKYIAYNELCLNRTQSITLTYIWRGGGVEEKPNS